jgi:hypothetical protein
MAKELLGEKWKKVKFDFEFTNDFVLEVSDQGRLRTFNKASDGNILNGSMINGYRIIRLKLYSPRDEKLQSKFDAQKRKGFKMARQIKALIESGAKKLQIREETKLLESYRKELSQRFQDDLKARTINYHSLVHRLVATYFLKVPKKAQIIVSHLDYNKLNNKADNLAWMTPEENYEHQTKSPYVLKDKKKRRIVNKLSPAGAKLTVANVVKIKKKLKENKSVIQLAKEFNVTDTQIYRIKRGENWKDV